MRHENLKPGHLGPFYSLMTENPKPDCPWVVLFHGYGASAADLAPLCDFIATDREINWAFPQGPLEIPVGPHMKGYAWFPIDESRLAEMMMTGRPVSLVDLEPPASFFKVSQDVAQSLRELGSDLILGGFSQGSMLTLQVTTELSSRPRGIALLSSSLNNRTQWEANLPKLDGLPYFQSHGSNDNVLSFEDAKKLHALLDRSGLRGAFHEFHGGHEIPTDILAKLNKWATKLLQ